MNVASSAISLLAAEVGLEPAALALDAVSATQPTSAGKITSLVLVSALVLAVASATTAAALQEHVIKGHPAGPITTRVYQNAAYTLQPFQNNAGIVTWWIKVHVNGKDYSEGGFQSSSKATTRVKHIVDFYRDTAKW